MRMVMCTKVNGKTTNLRAMAFICIVMERSTRANGSKISRRDMGLKLGQMEQNMREVIRTG